MKLPLPRVDFQARLLVAERPYVVHVLLTGAGAGCVIKPPNPPLTLAALSRKTRFKSNCFFPNKTAQSGPRALRGRLGGFSTPPAPAA